MGTRGWNPARAGCWFGKFEEIGNHVIGYRKSHTTLAHFFTFANKPN